jgi:multicomponent K+:H+ antiporter subunit D
MSHLLIAPVLLPLLAAALLLLFAPGPRAERAIGLGACAALVLLAALLAALADDGAHRVYALGAWPAPFGIVLVLDRTAALLLVVTAAVALAALAAAARGWDRRGSHFHALFQFQLAGLNGAFLTGDLFNLFVFFEVLLIASYCLLLHGLGAERLRAGLHYVVINLLGSAVFLISVALLYGLTGTLSMADLAVRVAALTGAEATLARSAGLLLLAVFALKAAVFPLYFWLPGAYAAAGAPVAALFAVMTKVGVYSIVRVYTLVFGTEAGEAAGIAVPWLLPAALVTLALGALGALAAGRVSGIAAYFTVMSVGTLFAALALASQAGLAAALYYMMHSSFAVAALFLAGALFAAQRGSAADRLVPGPAPAQPVLLGLLLLGCAISIAGLPPLSGFIGKLLVLQGARDAPAAAWIWTVVLGTSLLAVVCLMHAGSVLCWNTPDATPRPARAGALDFAPALAMLLCGVAMAAFAAPVHRYTDAAAAQLLAPRAYIETVLSAAPGDRARALPRPEARP